MSPAPRVAMFPWMAARMAARLALVVGAAGGIIRAAVGFGVVGLGGAGGCGADRQAEAPSCESHDQCPNGFMCGPAQICIPESPCETDRGCCPGAVCISGWCRPIIECDDSGRPCQGLGETCEDGACVAAPCVARADCEGADAACVAGRCVVGLPCGGPCDVGQACHLPSGRCVVADCGGGCAANALALTASYAVVDPLACNLLAAPCVCESLPQVPQGRPGVDGQLMVRSNGTPLLISYEPVYGDLVVSRFDFATGQRLDRVLDGLPLFAGGGGGGGGGAVDGYRQGALQAGPDRGRRPAIATLPETAGPVVDIVHWAPTAADGKTLHHQRYDPVTDTVLASSIVPVGGLAGRYSCVTQRGIGPGRTVVGLAFVEGAASGVASGAASGDAGGIISGDFSRLVSFSAQTALPTGSEQWRVSVVAERALPATAATPCDGACGLTEVCVRAEGAQVCGAAITAGVGSGAGSSGGCGAPCPLTEVCARLPGDAARCLPPVEVDVGWASRAPTHGDGLFVDCTADINGRVLAAWFDADLGQLKASAWPFDTVGVVDGGLEHPRGGHAAIAVSPTGEVGIAYQDAREGSLIYAHRQVDDPLTDWQIDVAMAGAGEAELGAWATVVFVAGDPVIVHTDAVGMEVWISRRDRGCWASAKAFDDVGFAFGQGRPRGLGEAGQGLWVSGLRLGFTPQLDPTHAPTVSPTPLPVCGQ